jgi:hypothetical protein
VGAPARLHRHERVRREVGRLHPGSTVVPEGSGIHHDTAVDGRRITVDVTALFRDAHAAGKLGNASADMVPPLTWAP